MSEREESEAKELYTGAEDFDKFDRKVQRWKLPVQILGARIRRKSTTH